MEFEGYIIEKYMTNLYLFRFNYGRFLDSILLTFSKNKITQDITFIIKSFLIDDNETLPLLALNSSFISKKYTQLKEKKNNISN